MMLKQKVVIAAGILVLSLSFITGVTYAWFTIHAETEPTSIEAGHLEITLTGETEKEVTFYPEAGLHTTNYILTNNSEITVFAVFVPGELDMYLLPSKYMADGYVIKEYRETLGGMKDEDKKSTFFHTKDISTGDVYFGTGETENGGWTLGTGCEYIDTGKNGETYFRLIAGGSVECNFKVGLTPKAGNEYQYSLFTLGGASVYATQDIDDAIKILKGDEL